MDARSLQFVVSACAGELRLGSPATTVRRVCTDSRRVQQGDLFFALAGERFDGHDFVAEAGQKATAVVVDRQRAPAEWGGCALILVESTRVALGQLAAAYRKEFSLPIVAVGGSNGKTTTKDLIAAVLREQFATLASEASFNNDIGVPATLLRLENQHQAAVLEVGTNHPGELAPLARWIQPRYGVITTIGREHLEFFGDVAGVAEEEGWLAELLSAEGKLFLNGDNEWTERIARRTRAAVVRVGLNEGNAWRAKEIRMDGQGTAFRVEAPSPEFCGDYQIGLLGRHQVVNALFAISLGSELGLARSIIQRG